MQTITDAIDLDVPSQTAYRRWLELDAFPRMMDRIREVRRLSDQRFHWQEETMDVATDWEDAQIIDQVPDRSIVWQDSSGPDNTAAAEFEPLPGERSRITVVITLEPESSLQTAAETGPDALYGQVHKELENFKSLVESRGMPA